MSPVVKNKGAHSACPQLGDRGSCPRPGSAAEDGETRQEVE